MKKILLLFALSFTCFMHAQENFSLEINGEVFDIELGKDYELKINNKAVKVKVKQNDILLYDDPFFSFKHPKEFTVAKSVLGEDIEQIVLMSAEGTGFIIQKYGTIDPTTLNALMMNEVTKESINYGFKMEREDYEKTLKSGYKMNVDRAVLRYKDEVNIYEITSTGKRDSGLIIMSMEMEDSPTSSGRKLINLIWDTLEIK